MWGMETDLQMIGLVEMLLGLGCGCQACRMSFRLEDTLRGTRTLRVQRRGAIWRRQPIGGREIDVHDGSGGSHARKDVHPGRREA